MSLIALRKVLKEKTITFGTEKTLKMLRNGKAKQVFRTGMPELIVKSSKK